MIISRQCSLRDMKVNVSKRKFSFFKWSYAMLARMSFIADRE